MMTKYQLICEQEHIGNANNTFSYTHSERAWEVLRRGNILLKEESLSDLLERVTSTIFSVEEHFGTQPKTVTELKSEFLEYMARGHVMLGTPTLANIGQSNAALASCVIIPVTLKELNKYTEECIRAYYKQNMGSGFNLTHCPDPVNVLHWLDEFSARETATGMYTRYIGNMGMLHVSHPAIEEFVQAKHHYDMKHFNISIDVSEEFMEKAKGGELFSLSDGSVLGATELLDHISENAWYNGDPGLVFIDRMNRDNPIVEESENDLWEMGKYVSTPPCGEMGLANGETCHFGYLNLRSFVKENEMRPTIDYDKLRRVTQLLTRVLDNAVEFSLPHYPEVISTKIAKMKRKIGIGVCGLADLLLTFKLAYESKEARELARDMLSFITYISKWSSVALAEQRGSCEAMNFPNLNKYISEDFLEKKYATRPTNTVTSDQWKQLATTIRETGCLRNLSTTALPPSGQTSLLLDATSSIEPLWSVATNDGKMPTVIVDFLSKALDGNEGRLEEVCREALKSRSFQNIEALSLDIRACLKTAKEIKPEDHLAMVAELAGLQGVVDESASKTVNLPHEATVDDVKRIFLKAYDLKLKNISLYRDKTKAGQPVEL